MMIKVVKAIEAVVCVVLISATISLCSCENKVVSDLNTPIEHENISISLLSLFGDEENTYIVAEVKLSENDSVHEGKIDETIITGRLSGGYSTNCIGYDDSKKTQIYLVHINSSGKCKTKIDFMNYRSLSNPMNLIVKANWTFTVDLRKQNPLVNTVYVNDDVISQIKVFEDGIIIVPAQEHTIEDLSNYKIEIKDQFDNSASLLANSLSMDKCYLSFGCILLDNSSNHSDINKLIIDEKEYLLK